MSKKETTVDASIAHMCFTRFTMSHPEIYKISALKVEYSAFQKQYWILFNFQRILD